MAGSHDQAKIKEAGDGEDLCAGAVIHNTKIQRAWGDLEAGETNLLTILNLPSLVANPSRYQSIGDSVEAIR